MLDDAKSECDHKIRMEQLDAADKRQKEIDQRKRKRQKNDHGDGPAVKTCRWG